MEWEYLTPPVPLTVDDLGKTLDCIARIKSEEPYTILTGKLQGDWTNRSKEDVVEAILEYNHKLLFVDRAMSEAVLTVEEMKDAVKELKETGKQVKDESEAMQNALMNVIDQLVEKGLVEI